MWITKKKNPKKPLCICLKKYLVIFGRVYLNVNLSKFNPEFKMQVLTTETNWPPKIHKPFPFHPQKLFHLKKERERNKFIKRKIWTKIENK